MLARNLRPQLLSYHLLPMQAMMFSELKGARSHMILDPTKNKYQESSMLFFNDRKKPLRSSYTSRPKTIQEIKKIQSFVKDYRKTEGQSLNASI
jgi:hypothetical protein